jgi:tyrosyl-tRNA synthetase
MLDFLRDTGKHFTVPYMLAKDSVASRLDAGLSYTEFSYMLLQAADFQHLYRSMGVEAQVGGADQWGNITAGLELIRKTLTGPGGEPAEAHGLSYPLLLDPSGAKFGKTSVGTSVWLDPERTSPYAFYQFLVDRPDTEVGKLLRLFTVMDRPEIEALEAEQTAHPERRPAQRALAVDLSTRVHGVAETERAMTISHAAFSDEPIRDPAVLEAMYDVLEHCDLTAEDVAGGALRVAIASGLFSSNGDARRAISQGGFSINDGRVAAPEDAVPAPIAGRWLLLRAGRKRLRIGRVNDGSATRR